MQVKLKLNIGTDDNKRLGLEKTREGETVTVDKEIGEELVKRGWADPTSKSATVDVPQKPGDEKTGPLPTTFKDKK